MPLSSITPPGRLDELSADGIQKWTEYVFGEIEKAMRGPEGNAKDKTDAPRAQFFNPLKTEIGEDAKEKPIFWTAFPKVQRQNATDIMRWEAADATRHRQDEYCEWAVKRNGARKITRVTFTSEVPEYWEKLAEDNPAKVLALYRDLVGPQVQPGEIFSGPNGTYNRENIWNSDSENGPVNGPVHLIQDTNNLHAAVELAAAATNVRVIDGVPKTSEPELIKCGGFGIEARHSDPHIGAEINELARQKADVTLADPPGLYINDFTPAGWKTPDGTPAKTFWRYTRGEKDRRLRGIYEVPDEKGYTVGDIKILGEPIDTGAQIADFVSIKVIGLACRFGQSEAEPFTVCRGG
jgi:hypothetical protein